MILINAPEYGCTVASLAMALELPMDTVWRELFTNLEYPFETPWERYPKVPSSNEICDWAWTKHGVGLVLFERNPICSPHKDCKPVPVWYNGESKFQTHLIYGAGLLEGLVDGVGHMTAWSGALVFDPRGYIYPFNGASAFRFDIRRFWLCT